MLRTVCSVVSVMAIGALCSFGIEEALRLNEDEVPKTELAREAAEWHYPKATQVGSGEADGKMSQTILMTKDDLEDVLKFYEKKSGQVLRLKKEETKTGVYLTGTEVQDGESVASILADDSGQPPDPRKRGAPPHGVIIRMLTQSRSKYFVSVVVSHTEGEKETHLVITYLKK